MEEKSTASRRAIGRISAPRRRRTTGSRRRRVSFRRDFGGRGRSVLRAKKTHEKHHETISHPTSCEKCQNHSAPLEDFFDFRQF